MAKIISLFLLWCGSFCAAKCLGQSIYAQFEQNRVQYENFEWSYVESDNFIIYFYQGGQDLARYALSVAETSLPDIRTRINYETHSKIEIVVYTKLSELWQTNMGQYANLTNPGGVTWMINNKYFVFFDGDHQHLQRDIRQGIAAAIMQNLLFGQKIQEIVQNSLLLDLPQWFTEGLVRYISENWNTTWDDEIRRMVNSNELNNIHQLTGEQAQLAGQAFWNYIAAMYGEKSIPNCIYVARVNRSMDNAFYFVMGLSTEQLLQQWYQYLQENYRFGEDTALMKPSEMKDSQELLKLRTKGTEKHLQNALLNPNASQLAYVTVERSRYRIFLKDLTTNHRKRILRAGMTMFNFPEDKNYPILCWNSKGNLLVYIYERREKIYIVIYNTETGERVSNECTKFQQIISACFGSDDNTLILSAVRNGYTDLYSYFLPNTRVTEITNDFYDDLDPLYFTDEGRRGILFASNRPNDSLKMGYPDTLCKVSSRNLFLYLFDKPDDPLHQLTFDRFSAEKKPAIYNPGFFSFLSDETGIYNRYLGKIDSSFTGIDTMVYYRDSISRNPSIPLALLENMTGVDSVKLVRKWNLTATVKPITDYVHHQDNNSIAYNGNKYLYIDKNKKNTVLYSLPLPPLTEIKFTQPNPTPYRQLAHKKMESVKMAASQQGITLSTSEKPAEAVPELAKTEPSLTEYYLQKNNTILPPKDSLSLIAPIMKNLAANPTDFQNEFDYYDIYNLGEAEISNKDAPKPALAHTDTSAFHWTNFRNSKVRVYHTNFVTEQIVTQVDKASSLTNLDVFTISQGNFDNSLNGNFRIGVTDLFENYKMICGLKIPLDFNSTAYFAQIQLLKNRLDKAIFFSRESEGPFEFDNNRYYKLISLTGFFSLAYPLDMANSFRNYTGFRHERIQVKATDIPTLSVKETEDFKKATTDTYFQNHLEYVHDDTYILGENNRLGFRWKVYYEFYKILELSAKKPAYLDYKNTGHLHNLGADVRHYKRVYKYITWANRLSAGKSFGPNKIGYTLGGMENWLVFDNAKRIEPLINTLESAQNYSFAFNANQMRGFRDYARIGSNYALYNSELKVPLFQTFAKRRLKKEFIRNFQVTGFFDMGMAWEGNNPFSLENRYITFDQPVDVPVDVISYHFFNPIIYGFGFGLRTTVMGYYLKFDRGWGLESGSVRKPINYLSLGYDF